MEEIRKQVNIYIDCSSDFAMINENITYSISIENTTDLDIENFFVSINIPENTEYCDESLISSDPYVISNEASGIILNNLKAKSNCNIFYKVEVIKVPEGGTIVNKNFIKYRNSDNEELELGSNTIHTRIKGALIRKEEGFRKTIVDGQLKIDEIITFEIIIKNTGNLTAFDLFLTDILPKNIEPLLDKVIVNNRILTLESLKEVPLGNLGPFKALTIRYKALVKNTSNSDEMFSLAKIKYRYFNDFISDYIDVESCSNEIPLNVNEAIIDGDDDFYCKTYRDKYFIDEEIFCRIKVRNSGNAMAYNSILAINLSAGLEIKNNKLLVNGDNIILNTNNKLELGQIEPFKEFIIKFRLVTTAISKENKFVSGTINYDYNDLEIGELVMKSSTSNIANFEVFGTIMNNNEKIISKKVNKNLCKIGDEIEHRLSIINSGNIKCKGLILNELDEYGKEVIKDSFTINGEFIGFSEGKNEVLIGDVYPNEKIDIFYKSKILDIPMDGIIRSRAYIEFNEGNRITERKKIWCKENEIAVIGPKIETNIEVDDFYNLKEENLCCKGTIKNFGNREAREVKIAIGHNDFVKINKIIYYFRDKEIEIFGSEININSLGTLETLEMNIYLTIKDNGVHDEIFINGEVDYFYFVDEGENEGYSEKHHIDKKYLNVFYPNIDFSYNNPVKGIESDEEFELEIIAKNTGNINFSNLIIDNLVPEGLELLYCSENTENNKISVGELRKNDEKLVTLILKGESDFYNNHIDINGRAYYEYYSNTMESGEKFLEPLTIEFINSQVELGIVSEKSEVILGEPLNNIVTIKNKGFYNFTESKLYIITNNINDIEISSSVIVNDKLYKINPYDNSVELREIYAGEALVIRYNINAKTTKKIKIYCKLTGTYSFEKNKEKREKTFYSNSLELKSHKVSLKSFLSANREIVYKGDKIKYSSVIINDGTVPIDFFYKMNVSKSLVSVDNGFVVNGILVNNKDFYSSTIEPTEGISIDQEYIYNNSFGGNKIFGESIINYRYDIDGNEDEDNYEVKTDRIFTEAASTTFKEIIVEHKEKLIDFEEELVSVSNVYVTANILNHYILNRFKNINTNNDIVSSNKVIVRGVINLKIEYISKTSNVYIHNKHLEFITFMILPKEYRDGDKIEIKADVGDVFYKIIDLSYLFLNINTIIKAIF